MGVKVTPTKLGLHLTQAKYVSDLLSKYNMPNASPMTTPMNTANSLTRQLDQLIHNEFDYRAIVGSLHYLSLTRPDIAFPVNKLAQFLSHPTSDHWKALKRVLRYLVGTLHSGIHLKRPTTMPLHAWHVVMQT